MKKAGLRLITLTFPMAMLAHSAVSQFAENITSTFKDDRATITYDLSDVKSGELYAVELFASYNKFNSPLQQVSGQVGKNIKEGKGLVIEWRASEEMGSLSDSVTFRIKVTLIYQPLSFIIPIRGSVRRGRAIIIDWQGGLRTSQAAEEKELTLYKDNVLVTTLNKTNIWTYTWPVPTDIKKGKGYTLKLTSKGETLESSPFRIKSKTSFLLKLTPLVAVAAIIPFLGGSDSKGSRLPDSPNPN